MADNFKNIKNLDIPFKEFMPGQIISSTQFNDDMGEIEEKINEIVGEHNGVANTVVEHLNNTSNPHQVTAHQVGSYTTDEADGLYEDLRHGHLYEKSITNKILADWSVDNRTIKDKTITVIKVDEGFGSQLDISENIEITDRYTKAEVDEIVQNRVGDGTYTKEELDQKFQNVQAGQIIDKTISADKVTSDFGDNVDISNNPSVIDKYTKTEVDTLIKRNGLPRDWGSITEPVESDGSELRALPVAGYMTVDEFVAPLTSTLDIDVKEVVDARGEFKLLSEHLNNINAKLKKIESDMQNVGRPTDEQVANVINQAIANGDIIAGGLTSTAQTLLISTLRNTLFTSDQSSNITILQNELAKVNGGGGGSDVTQYVISNNLSNATSSNNTVLVNANSNYTTTITANNGYVINSITVTMGGVDITSTVVSGKVINISSVTGNIVITVTTTASSSGGGSGSSGEMITNGLVNYFDFRNAEYNNVGSGGSTIIEATQGNGSLFCWANNMVTAQDNYGMTITRSLFYNANSVGTTQTNIKGTFTVAFLGYVLNDKNLFGAWSGYTNLSPNIKLNPSYADTSNSIKTVTSEQYATSDLLNGSGYRSLILTSDATTGIAKMYLGGKLIKTYTGSDYSDFNAWVITSFGATQSDVVKGTSMIVYDRVLSDVEVVDTVDFFKTLEVK